MHHRTRALLIMLLAAALLLTACAKVPTRKIQPQGVPGAAPDPADMTVRVLAPQGDPVLDALIPAYYAKYPNARVNKVAMPSGTAMEEAYRMRMSDGSVDVVPFYQTDAAVVNLVKAGQLMALDAYVKRAKFDLKPYGTIADQLRIGGELYDLPAVMIPQVILYNQEMFQAAGVPFPKPGWTWDDFRAAATKLKRDGIWGLSGPGTATDELVLQWLAGRMPGQRVPEERLLREALQFFTTLAFTDKAIAPSTKAGTRFTFTDDFANRRAAMSLEPLSFSSMAGRKINFRWGLAPFPVTPGSPAGGMIMPYTYAIVSGARNADAAWQFISFACGPEGAKALAKAGQVPLYNTPEVRQTWNDKQPAPPAGSDMLFATAWQMPPRETADAAADAALVKLINQVMSGGQAAEVAIPAYLQEVARVRADKK